LKALDKISKLLNQHSDVIEMDMKIISALGPDKILKLLSTLEQMAQLVEDNKDTVNIVETLNNVIKQKTKKEVIMNFKELIVNEGNVTNALIVALEATVKTLKSQVSKGDEKRAKTSIESIKQLLTSIESKGLNEGKSVDGVPAESVKSFFDEIEDVIIQPNGTSVRVRGSKGGKFADYYGDYKSEKEAKGILKEIEKCI
jgi:hypothetical protein